MSHEMAISTINVSKGLEMPCGNQFQAAQFGQGMPKTAFSCSVVVQHAKEIDGVTWQ
jgi:hypothetical protein